MLDDTRRCYQHAPSAIARDRLPDAPQQQAIEKTVVLAPDGDQIRGDLFAEARNFRDRSSLSHVGVDCHSRWRIESLDQLREGIVHAAAPNQLQSLSALGGLARRIRFDEQQMYAAVVVDQPAYELCCANACPTEVDSNHDALGQPRQLRANGENWNTTYRHHFAHGVVPDGPSNGAVPAQSHHDQIDLFPLRSFHDFPRDRSNCDLEWPTRRRTLVDVEHGTHSDSFSREPLRLFELRDQHRRFRYGRAYLDDVDDRWARAPLALKRERDSGRSRGKTIIGNR